MDELLQVTVNGIVLGSLLAIAAVGLTLVYGILRIVNFAHGDYLTFGGYMAFVANVTWGVHPVMAAAFAMVMTITLSVSLEFGLWRPLRQRGAGVTSLLLTSIGLALVLRHAIQWGFGSNVLRYRIDVFQSYAFGPIRMSLNSIVVIIVSTVLIIALGLFLSRSRRGKAMRAIADNPQLAAASGVNTDEMIVTTWVLAGGLAGLSGMLLAVLTSSLEINTGFVFLLPIFAAVILGGVGSPFGALAGGLAIGLITEVSTLAVPFQYKEAIAFTVMIAALLIRPQGLLGKARIL